MRSSLLATMPAGIAAALMSAGGLTPTSELGTRFLLVAVCGEHGGSIRIPLNDGEHDRHPDCPAACHVACTSRRETEGEP